MNQMYLNKYRINSLRLKTWDYSQNGYYFVTICTAKMRKYFGKIIKSEVILNRVGTISKKYWREIPIHYQFVILDVFIIMPNHIHGIIIFDKGVETGYIPSLRDNSLVGHVIGGFKAAVTRWCNKNEYHQFSWQSRYYERIIRTERELFNIRKYIIYNAYKWEDDEYFI